MDIVSLFSSYPRTRPEVQPICGPMHLQLLTSTLLEKKKEEKKNQKKIICERATRKMNVVRKSEGKGAVGGIGQCSRNPAGCYRPELE